MENQEKAMRSIPKNVRQIGERDDEIKLYIEDYVNTFIRKCAKTDKLVVGALIGEYYRSGDKEYLFVEGAVQAEQFTQLENRIMMTDESWSGLYGKIDEFFAGKSICGWFLCGVEQGQCSEGMICGFMYENIGGDKRALIVHRGDEDEESFAVYDENVIREQQGYYLFYERNQAMQSYMVTTALAVRTDPVAPDAVTASVRTRMVEKHELATAKSGGTFLSAAAMLVAVVALASGIMMMSHYDQLKEMESVLTGLTGNLLNMGETKGKEETEPQFGGLIIEDVPGAVNPIEPSDSETEESDENFLGENAGEGSSETVETGAEEKGTAGGENAEVSGTAAGEANAPETWLGGINSGELSGEFDGDGRKDNEVQSAAAPEYDTYLIQKGDTLVNICWKIYGRGDDELIKKICEINQLTDKNQIYAGQKLLIP